MGRANDCHRSVILVGVLVVLAASRAAAGPATRPVSFARDVGPILAQQCRACHDAKKAKGAYRVDTFERLMAAGDGKRSPVVAGRAEQSEMVRRLTTGDEDERMPQKADPLPAEQVALIRRWIGEGASFDGADRAAPLASQVKGEAEGAAPEVYRRPVPVTALAFSPDGKVIAAGGYHEVTLWDAGEGKLVGRIPGLPQRVYGLDFSPDGKALAVAGGTPGASGRVQVCAVERREAGAVLDRIGDCMLAVRYSPDGSRLAAGGADNAVRVYDAASGRRTRLIEQHADWVTDLAFSADGAWVVSASRDKSARVFDVKSGAMRSAFLGHEQPVWAVAFDAGGERVLSAGRDRKVRVWTAGEGKEVAAIGLRGGEVARMVVVGGAVVTAGGDGVVREYSVEKKAAGRTMAGGGEALYAIARDGKGRRVATGDHAGVVRVYDLERGAWVGEFVAAPGVEKGH